MLLESNVEIVVDKFRLFRENILFRRRIFMSSSNSSLVVARLASVNFTLVTRTIYRFLLWSIRADLMICNFHICYSTRTSTSHSTSLDASFSRSFTINHRHSTHSSRSFINSSKHFSRSLIVIRSTRHDRSSSFEALVTIIRHHSTHSSRSLIAFRSIHHDRSSSLEILLDITHERSTSIEVVKNRLIEARVDF